MRTPFAVAFLVTLLVAGTYWYSAVEAVCRVPVYYTLGSIDERFGLSADEVRTVLSDAELVWEEATGRNLFTYSSSTGIEVNFIYDERQQSAREAETQKEKLDAKEQMNEKISDTYASLVAEYKAEQLVYEQKKSSYERKLNAYNDRVQQYNDTGGAPPDVYEELEAEREQLDREQQSLNDTTRTLNDLSDQINQIGDRGNELIAQYNESVARFNDSFGSSEEFTQGDYQGSDINIYTFNDKQELTLVLAHEFGHALALDHVENEASVMYYLMGGQPKTLSLSEEDLAAFTNMCGKEAGIYERLRMALIAILATYGVL